MYYLWSESAFVGMEEAGVMKAGYAPFNYTLLFILKENNG